MANFTPNDVKKFTAQWKFIGNKSGEKLAELINNKIYLRNVAVNPLMLTIISFLYAQPKRVLPDNRVKFYSECIDALLEKWDYSKLIDRANEFETVDKRTVLSELAYAHITNSLLSDEEIPKNIVLGVITGVMKKLSRPIVKREKLLNELVHNAELLISVPPDGYIFPHRTFMEFFAAFRFFELNEGEKLLELYLSDQGRWEETLLLFCGLNTNPITADKILSSLLQEFQNSTKSKKPNHLVFRALLESTRINPQIADQILANAAVFLRESLDITVVENLGFIAMNPNWEHAKAAKSILLDILEHPNSDKEAQTILLSAIVLQDEEIKIKALKYADDINLTEFLTRLGSDSEDYAIKLLQNINSTRYLEIFQGLKEAGLAKFIINFAIKTSSLEAKGLVALVLFSSNNVIEFSNEFNQIDISSYEIPYKDKIYNRLFRRLKWNRFPQLSEKGILTLWLFCNYLTNAYLNEKDKEVWDLIKKTNKKIAFLAYLIMLEDKKIKIGETFWVDNYDFIFTNPTGRIQLWNNKGLINSDFFYLFTYFAMLIAYGITIIKYSNIYAISFLILSIIITRFYVISSDDKSLGNSFMLTGISILFQPVVIIFGVYQVIMQAFDFFIHKREKFDLIDNLQLILLVALNCLFLMLGTSPLFMHTLILSIVVSSVLITIIFINSSILPFILFKNFDKSLEKEDSDGVHQESSVQEDIDYESIEL